jgi:hypothetical protein
MNARKALAAIAAASALAATTAITTTAHAQFIKGNEAVQVQPDGTKKVETPPIAGALLGKPCPATQSGCTGGGWKMVETERGLMECTEVYARPSTCKPSTYGAERRPRVWVVKQGSDWKHCSYPDINKGCVSIKSLPSPKVQ